LRIEVPELSLLRPILSAGSCLALVLLFFAGPARAAQDSAAQPKKHTTAHPTTQTHTAQTATHGHKTTGHARTRQTTAHVRHARTRRSPRTAKSIARSRKLQRAFVASSQLRPMAQQLAQDRTPAAYAGVTHYAQSHTGDAAAAAYTDAFNASQVRLSRKQIQITTTPKFWALGHTTARLTRPLSRRDRLLRCPGFVRLASHLQDPFNRHSISVLPATMSATAGNQAA
jgi:hypothetical protein